MLKPRLYQEEAIEADIHSVSKGHSPLTIMATGTGKTVVMAKVIEWLVSQGQRTLVLAHRGLLLDQINKSLEDWASIYPSRDQGELRASWDSAVILSTPQTLKGIRLEKTPRNIGAIVIDECHRAVTPSMLEIYNHFNQPPKIGYTATADRPDGVNLSSVFSNIAYQYSLAKGIKEGYLAKIIGRRVTDMEIDLSALRVKMGDYADGELGELLEENLVPIAHNVLKECADRKKVLLFLPTVQSSERLAEVLSGMGASADYVSGSRGKDNSAVFAQFKVGNIKYLCSCQLVIEGYDEPAIDTIVMLRPTLSRIVYSQAIGRGTRIAPEKDHCLLVEFTFNSNKHKLVSPYELIGEDLSERVVESAELKGGDQDVDFMAVLDEAIETQYDLKSILERAVPRDFTFKSFNPLDIGDLVHVDLDNETDVWFQGRQLTGGVTPKQVEMLNRYMIDPKGLNKATASSLISALIDKNVFAARGFATPSQISYLNHLYPGREFPPDLTKAAAGLLITSAKEMINARA